MKRFMFSVFCVFCASGFAVVQPASADIQYRLSDLGGLGGSDSRALGINNSGTVVGWAYVRETEIAHAYSFSFPENSVTSIHPFGSFASVASGINNAGTIVGRVDTENHKMRSAIWGTNGEVAYINSQDIPILATAISDRGHITGSANSHAFRYENEKIKDLGTLGGSLSSGVAVNSLGTIVGSSLTGAASWQQRAFVSEQNSSSHMRDLGTLGGEHSQANGINDRGQIVGWANNLHGQTEAFAYENDATNIMRGLGMLGGISSSASDINENGDIVGWWSPNGYDRRAFVTIAGVMTDLTSLIEPNDPLVGWTLVEARAINDLGQIVGYGYDPAGIDRAFLLSPVSVPAPAPCIILFAAFGFSLVRTRR